MMFDPIDRAISELSTESSDIRPSPKTLRER